MTNKEKTAKLNQMINVIINYKLKRAAFTLAEVLITLGIIGVVAALTMPTLIQNHRKHVVETRLEKFYTTINQAIVMAENEFGEREHWDWSTTDSNLTDYEWYNKYLDKYIKSTKVIENNDATHSVMVYFADGSLVRLGRYGIQFYPEAKDFEYCENLENPNECSGKKHFLFFYAPNSQTVDAYARQYTTRLLEPYKYGWDGKESTLLGDTASIGGYYDIACTKEFPGNTRAYCTALIQLHGWKIPDNYPLKF